jgi:hypothetical protein
MAALRAPTADQIKRLYTLATQAGLDHAAVKGELHARYGVDSSKDLSLRQYENFTAFLQGMARAAGRKVGSGFVKPAAPDKLHSLNDCGALLRAEWPEIFERDQELAAELVQVLDCWRLLRGRGAMSKAIAATCIETIRKADFRDVHRTVTTYLTGYTTRNERYFLGILRGEAWRRKREDRKAQRQQADQKHQDTVLDLRVESIIKEAGGAPYTYDGKCACEGKGKVWWMDPETDNLRDVPCPWCHEGRRLLRTEMQGGRTYRFAPWTEIKRQIADRERRRPIADDDVGTQGD